MGETPSSSSSHPHPVSVSVSVCPPWPSVYEVFGRRNEMGNRRRHARQRISCGPSVYRMHPCIHPYSSRTRHVTRSTWHTTQEEKREPGGRVPAAFGTVTMRLSARRAPETVIGLVPSASGRLLQASILLQHPKSPVAPTLRGALPTSLSRAAGLIPHAVLSG